MTYMSTFCVHLPSPSVTPPRFRPLSVFRSSLFDLSLPFSRPDRFFSVSHSSPSSIPSSDALSSQLHIGFYLFLSLSPCVRVYVHACVCLHFPHHRDATSARRRPDPSRHPRPRRDRCSGRDHRYQLRSWNERYADERAAEPKTVSAQGRPLQPSFRHFRSLPAGVTGTEVAPDFEAVFLGESASPALGTPFLFILSVVIMLDPRTLFYVGDPDLFPQVDSTNVRRALRVGNCSSRRDATFLKDRVGTSISTSGAWIRSSVFLVSDVTRYRQFGELRLLL